MKYTVYHINMRRYIYLCEEWNKLEAGKLSPCPAPDFLEYAKVAEVEVPGTAEENLEVVFRLTNHVDHDWTKNDFVIPFGNQHRSTSVGDIVVTETGDRYICQPLGWKKLENAEPVRNPS